MVMVPTWLYVLSLREKCIYFTCSALTVWIWLKSRLLKQTCFNPLVYVQYTPRAQKIQFFMNNINKNCVTIVRKSCRSHTMKQNSMILNAGTYRRYLPITYQLLFRQMFEEISCRILKNSRHFSHNSENPRKFIRAIS